MPFRSDYVLQLDLLRVLFAKYLSLCSINLLQGSKTEQINGTGKLQKMLCIVCVGRRVIRTTNAQSPQWVVSYAWQ